jgi:hypothetical protein
MAVMPWMKKQKKNYIRGGEKSNKAVFKLGEMGKRRINIYF